MPLSNEEVLCAFMEPRPGPSKPSPHGANEVWWRWGWRHVDSSLPLHKAPVEYCWLPRVITLNECREIEARLIQMGLADSYRSELVKEDAYHWHASATQKIAALARVLRPVEG